MKAIGAFFVVCCVSLSAFAGDTNFVEAFDTIWKTHNASNILEFAEQNVVTNKSPETFFARGVIAATLQAWSQGATNYWEQAIQMLATNSVYSEKGKTNAIKQIRAFQGAFAGVSTNPPSWLLVVHDLYFTTTGDDAPFLGTVNDIATIEPAEIPQE